MDNDIWCLEYSKEQNCFHVDTLERSIWHKRRCFLNDMHDDFMILAIGNHEKMSSLGIEFRRRRSMKKDMPYLKD